jgi:hypothetical protein
MSNLWFNIRFGTRHFQLSNNWRFSFSVNPYFIENPPAKFFQIYCIFGKQVGL